MTAGTSSAARAQAGPLRRDWASISFEQFADLYHILCGYGDAGMPVAWRVMARWFECIARGDRIAAAAIRDEAWRRTHYAHARPIFVERLHDDLDAVVAARAPRVPAKTRRALDPSRCAFCSSAATTSTTRLWPVGDEFVETTVPYCGKC